MSDEKRIEVANRMYRNRGGAFWEEDMFHAWGTEAVRLVDPQTGEILDALYEARQRIAELEARIADCVRAATAIVDDDSDPNDPELAAAAQTAEYLRDHLVVPPPPQGENDE